MRFLLEKQSPNGGWLIRKKKDYEPTPYFRSLMKTAEAAMALFYNGVEYKAFARGVKYILKTPVDIHDYSELKATLARLLSILNSQHIRKRTNTLISLLLNTLGEIYEPLEVLGTYLVVDGVWWAIGKKEKEEIIQKILEGKAKDNKGWGARFNDKRSEPTFTANALLSLFRLGLKPEELEKEIEALISMGKNGLWCNSRLTVRKFTTYATALGAKILMLTGKDVSRSVEFLRDARNKDGGWPLVPGEESQIYTTYYVSELLWFHKMAQKFGTWNVFKNQLEYERLWLYRFLAESILGGKAMGSTRKAVERRKLIVEILSKSPMDAARVIDELKARGLNLNKKYHMTQIKVDLEHLRDLGIVAKEGYTYYLIY